MEIEELTMTRRVLTLVILLLAAAPLAAQPAEPPGEPGCQQLLENARELEIEAGATPRMDDALAAYDRALAVCDEQDLSPGSAAFVAGQRAKVLRYRNDHDEALAVLEDALREVTAALGDDHPSRIALLDQVSDLFASGAFSDAREARRVRALELEEEALRVRRAAYGERSREAARGLLRIAAIHLAYEPGVTEEYSRKAIEIARGHDDGVNPEVYEGQLMLEEALRRQGELVEAEEVQARAHRIVAQLEARGQRPTVHEGTAVP